MTYLGSELITNEQAILDLDGTNHVFRHAHHHLLLLELLGVDHGLLLALQLLLMSEHSLLLLVLLLVRLLSFLVLIPLIQCTQTQTDIENKITKEMKEGRKDKES